jgi:hypothetical protein
MATVPHSKASRAQCDNPTRILTVGGSALLSLRLHCYLVIELKSGKFKPEWAGKLNFYLSAVDDLFRNGPDAPTIGLLLCETHNSAVAEYALRDVARPIGVSTYRVTRELPAPVRDELPTLEDLQEVVAKLRSEMKQLRKERPDE